MLHRVASITHSSISATTLSFISSFQISQTIPVTLLNKILCAPAQILEPPRKSAWRKTKLEENSRKDGWDTQYAQCEKSMME